MMFFCTRIILYSVMFWLEKVYRETTDPRNGYERLVNTDVIASIVVHVVVYIGAIFLLQHFTKIRIVNDKQPTRLAVILGIIMTGGYIARLCRVKAMYHVNRSSGYNEEVSLKMARDQINQGYVTWYFLA